MMKKMLYLIALLFSCVANAQGVDIKADKWEVRVGKMKNENGVLEFSANSRLAQPLVLRIKSRYRVTAQVKCGSGAENVFIQIMKGHSTVATVTSVLVDWNQISFVFQTYLDAEKGYRIEIGKSFSDTDACGWMKDIRIERIGDALAEVRCGIKPQPKRVIKEDLGLSQQSDQKMAWFLDAKLGLFIHWGIYAGPGRGEWLMENQRIPIETYRKYAYPESGDEQFLADKYDPQYWAEIANAAGIKYAQFTTQHHDGYALFHTKSKGAFSSYNTLNRDLTREYVDAFRNAGIRIGFYKTLINWRYPGYYDVFGINCKPNKWGYKTARWHKENAKDLKNELYCMTKELMSNYGKIDAIFWDGGWLAQKGSDKDARFFWEPGMYASLDNEWAVDRSNAEFDPQTGQQLGLMGMVRKLQPDIITNRRAGWVGDFDNDEGGALVSGPIRSEMIIEKCMSLHSGWGYSKSVEDSTRVWSVNRVKKMFADCLVRNMNLLINVGPDRHGCIPKNEERVLRNFGLWVKSIAPAVYGTRGGPWNPEDEQFGFTYKENVVYVFIYRAFDLSKGFLFPNSDPYKIVRAYDVKTGASIQCKKNRDGSFRLSGIEHLDDVVTVVAVELNKNINF